MIPRGYQYKTPYIRNAIEQGRVEGRTEGRIEGQALSVLEVFEAREIAVSEEQRSRILACTDLEQLSQWLKRALKVTSVEELFTQLARCPCDAGIRVVGNA
jgi:predicted transposase YdaD